MIDIDNLACNTKKNIEAPRDVFSRYCERLKGALDHADWDKIVLLAESLLDCWKTGKNVFICGNGGSAGNAAHVANDFLYGISKTFGSGLKVHALTANASVLTCLANDEGYDKVFSYQLAVQAERGDVLIVFSGSGNSANILSALETATKMQIKSFAILGFGGGKAHHLADVPITFPLEDMQISEDLQLIICHMIMQWLYQNR